MLERIIANILNLPIDFLVGVGVPYPLAVTIGTFVDAIVLGGGAAFLLIYILRVIF